MNCMCDGIWNVNWKADSKILLMRTGELKSMRNMTSPVIQIEPIGKQSFLVSLTSKQWVGLLVSLGWKQETFWPIGGVLEYPAYSHQMPTVWQMVHITSKGLMMWLDHDHNLITSWSPPIGRDWHWPYHPIPQSFRGMWFTQVRCPKMDAVRNADFCRFSFFNGNLDHSIQKTINELCTSYKSRK